MVIDIAASLRRALTKPTLQARGRGEPGDRGRTSRHQAAAVSDLLQPIVNLKGMGIGSRVLKSRANYDACATPGHFWMRLLEGRQVSSDLAVVDGEPRWWRHLTGKPAGAGTFDYWTIHAGAEPEIEARCGAWVLFGVYRGVAVGLQLAGRSGGSIVGFAA